MIRSAIFDIGNVLLFFSHDRMCRQLAEAYRCAPGLVHETLFSSGLAELYDAGRVTTDEVFSQLAKAADAEPEPGAARRAAQEIFDLNEEIVPVVEDLARGGTRLVLLSNTCEVHSSWFMGRYDVLDHFASHVFSWEEGLRKPQPEIFRLAVERSECEARECFFTDDIPAYTAAARREGLESATFRGAAGLREELVRRGVEHLRA